MGWFFVNVVVPIGVPMMFMLLAKMVPLPAAASARTRLITLVQDGQLGWVALGFATSSTYDVYSYLTRARGEHVIWAEPAFCLGMLIIPISAFLAALGALFPYDNSLLPPTTFWKGIRQYSILTGTFIVMAIAAVLYIVVHSNLPVSP